jgi:hypothetical protein
MINIFNPVRVFKDELSSSWATNIKTSKKDSTNIPINKNSVPPVLVMDALPDVEYFIGVLPIYRSWAPTDISQLESLKFNITTSKTEYPDVKISLVSKQDGDDEQEIDSDEISLADFGLMNDCEQEFIVPLSEFSGDDFDISKVRSLKIVGCGKFNLMLSGIILE